MKLTRASSYALHALAYMAAQKKQDQPIASHKVAAAVKGIPKRFLLKVLHPLVEADVLRSIKGPNGGYRLARPASEISLLEILEAVDGPIEGDTSFKKQKNSSVNHRLDEICHDTAEQTRKHLKKIRLSELTGAGAK